MPLARLTIGSFLKEHRRLLPREAAALGSYARHPSRVGKLVNQEEIAAAIGVTRVWYAMLESGAALQASPRLLARLADALSLSDESRRVLFALGLPDLSLSDTSVSVLMELSASVAPLRVAARRVLSATSENEILVVVAEALSALFRDADFVGAFRRVCEGQWDYPATIGASRWRTSLAELHEELFDGLTPGEIDQVLRHGSLSESGQVGARNELPLEISLKRRMSAALESVGIAGTTFLQGHVKSREGLRATLCVNYVTGDKHFSELERSLVGTLADLASLALSRTRDRSGRLEAPSGRA